MILAIEAYQLNCIPSCLLHWGKSMPCTMLTYSRVMQPSTVCQGMLNDCCRGQRLNEHIVIGAHGRLKNLLSKRQLDVSAIKILVFDEADIMLEVGSCLKLRHLHHAPAADSIAF